MKRHCEKQNLWIISMKKAHNDYKRQIFRIGGQSCFNDVSSGQMLRRCLLREGSLKVRYE